MSQVRSNIDNAVVGNDLCALHGKDLVVDNIYIAVVTAVSLSWTI